MQKHASVRHTEAAILSRILKARSINQGVVESCAVLMPRKVEPPKLNAKQVRTVLPALPAEPSLVMPRTMSLSRASRSALPPESTRWLRPCLRDYRLQPGRNLAAIFSGEFAQVLSPSSRASSTVRPVVGRRRSQRTMPTNGRCFHWLLSMLTSSKRQFDSGPLLPLPTLHLRCDGCISSTPAALLGGDIEDGGELAGFGVANPPLSTPKKREIWKLTTPENALPPF